MTTALISPLDNLFILLRAILRSSSFKKEVDSGLSGSKNTVNAASTIEGIPYGIGLEMYPLRLFMSNLDNEQKPPVLN